MADTNNNNSSISVLEVTEAAAGNNVPPRILLDILNHVENLDKNMSSWAKNGTPSQANARSFGNDAGSAFRNRQANRLTSFDSDNKNSRKGFMDSFEEALIDGFLGSGFKKEVGDIFKGFAGRLNTDIDGIQGAIGKQLGQSFMSAFKNTDTGRALTSQLNTLGSNFLTNISTRGNAFVNNLVSGNLGQRGANAVASRLSNFGTASTRTGNFLQGAGFGIRGLFDIARGGLSAVRNAPGFISSLFKAPQVPGGNGMPLGPQDMPGHVIGPGSGDIATQLANVGNSAGKVVNAFTGAGGGAGGLVGAGGQVTKMLAGMGPHGWAVIGAMVALELVTDRVMEAFKDIGAGVKQIFGAISAASKRDIDTRKKNLELSKQRMKDDYETMVKYPFELLQKAATDLYNAWDSNLTKISATQGYNKSDVQDLMANYAERIRNEGLSKYVNGANLMDNLAKVLDSGLSNKIAEEFAYQATLLNKAVPTQDFFSYAATYASVAANAQRAGESEAQAIEKANASLRSFASSLLYADRELTGGFTTGLQNASSLYKDAANIALAAQSDNIDAISSTLVAVQGYIGAVAPDLADGLVGVINKLATGGNSSETVALRSLAGVNASNTEFLRAFAKDPQAILGAMFENLSAMFTESPDAYMEKAEGYASLFGVDAAAFQRVDFADLARAIKEMNVNNSSLSENMALLREGQTTTTTEQLKNQQITEYMINEGLALVLDNEANRAIQQHMWDEQLQRDLVQSTFSVELIGETKEGLLKIGEGVQKILDFLNPFSWLKKLGNVITTADEAGTQKMDVAQMLQLTAVGRPKERDLRNLLTYNESLNLTQPLVNQLGGRSLYGNASGFKGWYGISNTLFGNDGFASSSISQMKELLDQANGIYPSVSSPTSKYSWGSLRNVSKTQGRIADIILNSATDLVSTFTSSSNAPSSALNATANAAKQALDRMMDQAYIKDEFVKKGKTYEDWASTSGKFGIADLNKAMESAGYQESDIRKFFEDAEARAGQEEQHERNLQEEAFWKSGQNYWDEYYPNTFAPELHSKLDVVIQNQEQWYEDFFNSWKTWTKDEYPEPWLAWLGTDKQTGAWGKWVGSSGAWSKWIGGSKENPASTWSDFTKAISDFWGFGTKRGGTFQELYTRLSDYMAYNSYYGVSSNGKFRSSTLLKELESIKVDTKKEERKSIADQMGQVLADTLITDQTTDPTLQTNILLGQILVYVGQIVQQTNTPAGGTSFIDTLSAMSLGLTQKTP